jgi:hypothetical protein
MPNIGLNFSPTQGGNTQNGQNGQRSGMSGAANPVMDAIKILSFRVPQTLGANAPVAQPLIGGAGGNAGSGLDNSAMVMNWLNRFFGPGAIARQPVPAWNPMGQDWNAMPAMGNGAAMPSVSMATGDPNAMGAGSSLPGAQTPPARPAFNFPTTQPPSGMGGSSPSPLGDALSAKNDWNSGADTQMFDR